MRTVRQMASGIVYAIVSLVLVIGSLSLSLAEGRKSKLPTAAPTNIPSSTSTSIPTVPSRVTESPSPTTAPTTTTSEVPPTSTFLYPTLAATVRASSTSAVVCGPYAGWVRAYLVQPGDTLFRIATRHGISVETLQRANCRTGTVIYAGERLWVPFVLPPATQLTIIPTFDTPTEPATETATATPTDTATQTQDP